MFKRTAMAGVNAGVVGILGVALYDPVWTSAIHTRADFGLALLLFGLQLAGSTSWLVTDAPVIAGNKEPGHEAEGADFNQVRAAHGQTQAQQFFLCCPGGQAQFEAKGLVIAVGT
ncbi:Chromate transport protein ChrA [Alcaligenes faecalis subsp. faecalis NCIB 8687]|nr:Chromate transport protein ChrA [Alcaligenes faecalis subsp. faecalis NCIB 8687]